MKTACRHSNGVAIAEAAASISLLLPLFMLMVFVILEASYAYLIKDGLAHAARQASRDLAIAYGKDPVIANNRSLQNAQVFDRIRIQNIVNSSQQFDDPVFNTASDPATVSLTVRYLSRQFGLPAFPNPDPLRLGNSFVINGTATYRLE
ncbi:MAG: pilus assembly protein [Candidatus Melainabacteria bacterium]|nr:pilus assembly protein [Candidatus Melainabacteria bacterium]